MEGQQAGSSTAVVPQENESTDDVYVYDQWGNVPLYLPYPLKTNDYSAYPKPWIRVNQEPEKYKEYYRSIAAGQDVSPLILNSKSYVSNQTKDTILLPTVYKSNLRHFIIGTRDRIIRILRSYNLSKFRDDYTIPNGGPDEIIDISTGLHPDYILVLTINYLWQIYLPGGDISRVGPPEHYLKMFKTGLATFAMTVNGYIIELKLVDRDVYMEQIVKIASEVEDLVVVENIGGDTRSGVLLAISNCNKVAILRLTYVGKEYCARLLFQFRVYTQGSLMLETSDSHLIIHAKKGWRDRETELATLRIYTWKNLIQRRPAYEELFLPGYKVKSIVHKKSHLTVTLDYNIIVVFDVISLKRICVIITPEQPVMAKFERGFLTYTSDDVFRVTKIPKASKICSECLSVFDSPMINSHNSVSTIFVCRDYFLK